MGTVGSTDSLFGKKYAGFGFTSAALIGWETKMHELQRLFRVNWHYDYIQLTGEVPYIHKFLCSLIDTV